MQWNFYLVSSRIMLGNHQPVLNYTWKFNGVCWLLLRPNKGKIGSHVSRGLLEFPNEQVTEDGTAALQHGYPVSRPGISRGL